jgi:hypothetical protein
MGALVIGSLVIKRMRERPRRKWKIWLGDVSKQVVGQAFVHATNVAISGAFVDELQIRALRFASTVREGRSAAAEQAARQPEPPNASPASICFFILIRKDFPAIEGAFTLERSERKKEEICERSER